MWAFDSMVKEFSNPFSSVDTLADVFIYLVDKKGLEICFQRLKPQEFECKNKDGPEFKWIRLKINEPMNKGIEKDQSGIVQVKL
jgi:hypothetical protein